MYKSTIGSLAIGLLTTALLPMPVLADNSGSPHEAPSHSAPAPSHSESSAGPCFEPAAPRYEPAAPHYQLPSQPRFENPPPGSRPNPNSPAGSAYNNSAGEAANGDSPANVFPNFAHPTQLHVTPQTNPTVVVRNGVLMYSTPTATEAAPSVVNVSGFHGFNGFAANANNGPTGRTFVLGTAGFVQHGNNNRTPNPFLAGYYNPFGYYYGYGGGTSYYGSGLGYTNDGTWYVDPGSPPGYDDNAPSVPVSPPAAAPAPVVPAPPATPSVQTWTVGGRVQSISDNLLEVAASNGVYSFVLSPQTSVNQLVNIGDSVQVTFSVGNDGSYRALSVSR